MSYWQKASKNQKFGFIFFIIFFIFGFSITFAKAKIPTPFSPRFNKEDIGFGEEHDEDENYVCSPPPEQTYSRNWNLNAWLTKHSSLEASLRNLQTSQKGRIEPATFPEKNLKKEVNNFRRAWSAFVGPIPRLTCVPLDPKEEPLDLTDKEKSQLNFDAYTLKKVSYQGDHGARIPAYLFIPKDIEVRDRVPAVLVMHQANAVCGKKESIGVCGNYRLNFAEDLAEKGYVVLAPDSIGYGERSKYYEETGYEYSDAAPLLSRFPSSTLMGLRIADVMRGVDYLKQLNFVDDKRIGMIGHSNGGIETLFSAAFDNRIKCAVSNGGPNLIRREILSWGGKNPGIARWAGGAYMPTLGFFNNDVKNLPIEMHQLYAMIAPRGLFISLMEDDSIAPNYDRVQFSMDEAAKAFKILGGNFAYHTIASGLTPENELEWAGPMNIAENYTK